MPTAARLVAAMSLALLAFIASGLIMPLMPEGTGFGYFTHVNIAVGVLCGWLLMGKAAGKGFTAAINNGITGMVAMVFWALFVQGAYEMIRQAMRFRFDGPFEALMAILQIGFEYASTVLMPHVLLTLLVGGILAGFATEYASKRWR